MHLKPSSVFKTVGMFAGAAVIATTLTALPFEAESATAAATSVTADFSSALGANSRVGAGFLYGLGSNGASPPDSLLAPLKPNLFRGGGARMAGNGWIGDGNTAGPNYQARIDNVIGEAARVTAAPYNAEYQVILTDIYGQDGVQPSGSPFPCPNNNCADWDAFVTQAVADLKASGLPIAFDPVNEPRTPGFGTPAYYSEWDHAYSIIKAALPSAKVVGPSQSFFSASDLGAFLDHTKAAGTVPDELNWHFSVDPVADSATAQSLLAARGITGVTLTMNEYLLGGQQSPSYTAWYLARLQRSSVSTAAHAIWSSGPNDTLDNILTSTLDKTGRWWTYQRYADLGGNLVATTGSGSIDLVASTDASLGQGSILLGSNDNTYTGTVSVQLTGLGSAAYLNAGSGSVRASIYRLSEGLLATPQLISDQSVPVTAGSASITVPWANGNDAYSVVLTSTATTVTTVDGNVKGTGGNQFAYSAGWGLTTGVGDMYLGTANYSGTTNATASFEFTGAQLALRAVRDSNVGIIAVSVDGGSETLVDNYSPTRNAAGMVYTTPVLDTGHHTLKVRITGTKNPASSGYADAIDRADVFRSRVIDGTQTSGSPSWAYSSGWTTTNGINDMFSKTANGSATVNSTATLTFFGTQVALHGVKDYNAGIVAISIDGGPETNVDAYSATRSAAGTVFTSPVLSSGSHTLRVRITGTKNAASSGSGFAIDRADTVG